MAMAKLSNLSEIQREFSRVFDKQNKAEIKKLLIQTMQNYLTGKGIDTYDLDVIGHAFLSRKSFENLRLDTKCEEIFGAFATRIEFMSDKDAKKLVKELLEIAQDDSIVYP